MGTLNTAKIPLEVQHHSKLALSFDHVTSSQFMTLQPIFYRHCMKTEKGTYKGLAKISPQPMPVPTYGRCRQNLRAFFVPYRLVFPNWEAFIDDNIASNYTNSSLVTGVPFFEYGEMLDLFVQSSYNMSIIDPNLSPNRVDFFFNGNQYRLTPLGRYAMKLFNSLGYKLMPSSKNEGYNALALLAYVKVYLDWYANSQYLNSVLVLQLERYLKFNDPANRLILRSTDLYDIVMFVRKVQYDTNGYFEGAWDNPVSPNNGQFTSFTFDDPTSNNGSAVIMNSMGSPEMTQNNTSSLSLGTTYLHNVLQRLSEYQHRHALSGARSIDRVLSQYGIITSALKLERTIYCGVKSNDVNIGKIYATSASSNGVETSNVGDYSGAGNAEGEFTFDFENEDEGIFFVMQTIQPSGGYYQGYDRNNRHLTKKQFFNAAFDSLGVQAIEKGEVYVSRDLDNFGTVGTGNTDDYHNTFGFTGRYGEFKRSISMVTGDVASPFVMPGGNSWHLMREFSDMTFNGTASNIAHSEDFCRGNDADQYLRIFNYGIDDNGEYIDPFYVFCHIDYSVYAPCRSLTDTFDWEDTTERITLDINGSKLN